VLDILHYVTLPFILEGAGITFALTVIGMSGAVLLGLTLAVMKMSTNRLLRWPAAAYVWLMRGTPLLLQLIFLFDVMPQYGLRFDAFTTAALGFVLNEAAYEAEIFRGGIAAVGRDQRLAAASLGMSDLQTLRRVLIPQALRAILPTLGNQAAGMLKTTSLASVIAVNELTLRTEQIASSNFQFITLFAAAAVLYLIMTSVVAVGQSWLERKVSLDRVGQSAEQGDLPMAPGAILPGLTTEGPSESMDGSDEALALEMALASPLKSSRDPDFITCRNVEKSYAGREVLCGINLTVREGEVVVLMGPSGSGKSTFLRLINHLDEIDAGEILVAGKPVGYEQKAGRLVPVRRLAKARADARIAMVFQHFNLFSHRSALENVIEAPILVYHQDKATATRRARVLLGTLGLGQHLNRLPHALSGGQQQRVAIARALATDPRLLLLDEPTSALDPELVGEVLNTIRALAHTGITMLVATHERDFAREVADRVVFMDGGTIIEEGTPTEVLDHPQQDRTRQFLRQLARSTND
jgi:polar amino acid transport system permease protein